VRKRAVATMLLFAFAGLAASAPAAHGASAQKFSYRFAFVRCSGPTSGGGTAALTVSTTRGDSIADVFRWNPGKTPFEDPPDLSGDPQDPIELLWVGDSITGAARVYSPPGGPFVGMARWSLAVVPGEPIPFESRARNGNRLTRESGSTFALAATGMLTFPDGEVVALTTCEGSGGENSVFQNAPRATVEVTDVSQASCDVVGPAGRRLIAAVDASSVSLLVYAPGADPELDPPLLFGATEDASFTRRTLAATVPLFAPTGDDSVPAGEAVLSATVKAGRPSTTFERSRRSYVRVRTWPLRFAGALLLPGGERYDLARCMGARFVIQLHRVP
jgi:hypothetical protein